MQLLSGSMRMIWNYFVLLGLLVMHWKYADATNLVLWLKSISNCKFYGRNKRHTSRMKCAHFIWMNKVNKQHNSANAFLPPWTDSENPECKPCECGVNFKWTFFYFWLFWTTDIHRASKQYSNSVFNIQRGNRWQSHGWTVNTMLKTIWL